jgi:arginase
MNIDIIGVPIDLGANRRGVDMGPSAIRYAGLQEAIMSLGINTRDIGNINVALPENFQIYNNSKMKHMREINKTNKILSEIVYNSILSGNVPLIIGGDHSIAAGSIIGAQNILQNIGVIWIDAHGDFNTEKTTLTGNIHGMPLAAVTGTGSLELVNFKNDNINFIDPKKIVLIGIRSIDPEEGISLKKSGINIFTMADIDMLGMKEIMKKAIKIVEKDTSGIHLSFDMDALSPNEAPGVGTAVPGGLTYREAHLAAEMISESKKLRSVEFVEVNPIEDYANKTAELAVSLICSVLGKKIL